MHDLECRIALAKQDNQQLDQLIKDYLPFIKKTIANLPSIRLEYDDKLSLSMLTFMDCVKKYEPKRGNFIAFTAHCIRNRLINESQKQSNYTAKVIPLSQGEEYVKEQTTTDLKDEQTMLQDEIQRLSTALKAYDISFQELPKICPKQKRSRSQCLQLAKTLTSDDKLRSAFLRTHRLPQKELASAFQLSLKTIEKHRKYIVTLSLMLIGNYPGIRSFLPQYKEVR